MTDSGLTILTPAQTINFGHRAKRLEEYPDYTDSFVSEILQSILFNGSICADVPAELMEGAGLSRLAQEELLKSKKLNYADDIVRQITSGYELAWNAMRDLEQHPAHAPLVPYEFLTKPPKYSQIELAELHSDLEFGISQIERTLSPLIDGAREIYEHYFEESLSLFNGVTEQMLADRGVRKASSHGSMFLNLNRCLGLYLRSAEEISMEFSSLPFTPNDLRNINESYWDFFIDTSFAGQLEENFDVAFGVDPHEKRAIKTMIKTAIDMHNATTHASQTAGMLFLPSGVSASEAPAGSFAGKSTDFARIYKLFMSERHVMPRIRTIDDVLRLRDDKGLIPLRQKLKAWNELNSSDDAKLMVEIRKEIEAATKELRWAQREESIGQIVSWVCLPLGVAELMMGTPFSLIAGAGGIALSRDAARRVGNAKWISFGLGSS